MHTLNIQTVNFLSRPHMKVGTNATGAMGDDFSITVQEAKCVIITLKRTEQNAKLSCINSRTFAAMQLCC